MMTISKTDFITLADNLNNGYKDFPICLFSFCKDFDIVDSVFNHMKLEKDANKILEYACECSHLPCSLVSKNIKKSSSLQRNERLSVV